MNRITNENEFRAISTNMRDAFKYLGNHMPDWGGMQNNLEDRKSSIIYRVDNYFELINTPEFMNASAHQKNYYTRRWFNHKWALCDEYLFAVNSNCTPNPNYRGKDYDVDIAGRRVDVKGTVVPKDLVKINGADYYMAHPDELSTWFYEKQSKEGRFGLQNRLFIVHTSYKDPDRTRFAFDSKRKVFERFCRDISSVQKFPYSQDGIECYGMIIFLNEREDGMYYFIPGVTPVETDVRLL